MRTWPVLVLFALPLLGADWVRISAPEAIVFTDAGEKPALSVLARLAELRAIFSDGIPLGTAAPRLQIYLFSSPREFRTFTDSPRVDGFYQSGPGFEIIVLHTGAEAQRTLAHEYTHLLLAHSRSQFPGWVEEGMAEFYSTLSLDGKHAMIGGPISSHKAALARDRWLEAPEFFAARGRTHASDTTDIFYAQSWAMVHMLNLAPGYRDHAPEFFSHLLDGDDVEDALYEAFELTRNQVLTDLRAYLNRMTSTTVDASITVARTPDVSVPLSKIEASTTLAELALRTNHPARARSLLADIARANPDSPAIEAALGLEAGASDDRAAAIRHLEQAISLGSREAWVRFELALRQREAGTAAEQFDPLMRAAIELDPNFAEPRFLLGVRLTDRGDTTSAIPMLEAAARLEPRKSSYWHALAFALDKGGRKSEALAAALQAVRTAQTSSEESMATILRDSLRVPF